MKVRVYHLSWEWACGDAYHFDWHKPYSEVELAAVANKLFSTVGAYHLVAMVEADSLEDVFRLTNTIHHPWWENEGVTCYSRTRSTSVGDLYLLEDGTVYLVLRCGLLDIDNATEDEEEAA